MRLHRNKLIGSDEKIQRESRRDKAQKRENFIALYYTLVLNKSEIYVI